MYDENSIASTLITAYRQPGDPRNLSLSIPSPKGAKLVGLVPLGFLQSADIDYRPGSAARCRARQNLKLEVCNSFDVG